MCIRAITVRKMPNYLPLNQAMEIEPENASNENVIFLP